MFRFYKTTGAPVLESPLQAITGIHQCRRPSYLQVVKYPTTEGDWASHILVLVDNTIKRKNYYIIMPATANILVKDLSGNANQLRLGFRPTTAVRHSPKTCYTIALPLRRQRTSLIQIRQTSIR